MEAPQLVRRGEARRISEAFARSHDGKLTTVEGVSPLHQRLYTLCLSGDGSFDFAGLAALKTYVDIGEALAIEAIKCAAGDHRHDFQEWYPEYKAQQSKRAKHEAGSAGDTIDPVVAAQELAMVKQAIQETEEMLAEHRSALLEKRPSPYSDADVDGMHSVLTALKANLAAIEAAAAAAASSEDGGTLEPLKSVGLAQSGTLREVKRG